MLYISEEEKMELIDSIDMSTLVDDLGLQRSKSGSRYSILCPCPNHKDKRRGNCIVYSRNVYCFGCGKSYDAVGLVSEVKNINTYDAVCYLAEMCGRADEFEQKGGGSNRFKHYPALDRDALKTLGLGLDRGEAYSPIGFIEKRENNCRRDLDGYCKVEPFRKPKLSVMKVEEPELYQWILKNKASEMEERLDNLIFRFSADQSFIKQMDELLQGTGCAMEEFIDVILEQKSQVRDALEKLLR